MREHYPYIRDFVMSEEDIDESVFLQECIAKSKIDREKDTESEKGYLVRALAIVALHDTKKWSL